MGAYLHIGFVAKATADLPDTLTKQIVNEELEDYYSSDTFDCKVSKGKIIWTLKQEVVKEELAEFVETFYQDYYGHRKSPPLDFVREIAHSKDWLKQAVKAENSWFSVAEDGCDESFNIVEKQRIRLNTTTIVLGYEGKFLMEQSACTLRFLETCAQKAYSDFKLGKTVRVFVY